jgi:hypothetical protein
MTIAPDVAVSPEVVCIVSRPIITKRSESFTAALKLGSMSALAGRGARRALSRIMENRVMENKAVWKACRCI